jgi:spore maturation protein SpmA
MDNQQVSKGKKIIGYVISALIALALGLSAVAKLLQFGAGTPELEENMKHIGWRSDQMTALGIVELSCVIIYLIPQTSILGAILITAYMGGAIATHARVGDAFIAQILVGVLAWLGLWLREPRLWPLMPIRK